MKNELRFTIDGEEFQGTAKVVESRGGLLDIHAVVAGRHLNVIGWSGRVLRFEGEAEHPDGTVKHVCWNLTLEDKSTPDLARFIGAGIPPDRG